MRIDLGGSAALSIGGEQSVGGSSGSSGSIAGVQAPEDTTSLSSSSLSVSSLATQALEAADSMEARVESLRAAVSNSQYTLDPSALAEAMLSESF